MKGIVKKWFILVTLNSVVPFWLALILEHTGFFDFLAMILGMVTFVAIYSKIDLMLIQRQKYDVRKSLFWAAVLKIFTQAFPVIEITTGSIATEFVESILGRVLFFSTYFKTITEGILLSLIVAVLMMLVQVWFYLIRK